MNVTPSQLRKLIDACRKRWYNIHQTMEVYEAIVFDHPGMKYVPGTQKDMKADLERLRADMRTNSEKARKMSLKMEEVLAADEEANWWKGEDRFVELCL